MVAAALPQSPFGPSCPLCAQVRRSQLATIERARVALAQMVYADAELHLLITAPPHADRLADLWHRADRLHRELMGLWHEAAEVLPALSCPHAAGTSPAAHNA